MEQNINANDLLKKDHKEVKATYEKYISAESEQKNELAKKILTDLTVHADLEEEMYYPELENAGEQDLVAEFRAEHDEAKQMIERLAKMEFDDPEFDGTMTSLMESVNHHIEEEEAEAMTEVEEILGKEKLMEIGEEMMDRREELYEAAVNRLWNK